MHGVVEILSFCDITGYFEILVFEIRRVNSILKNSTANQSMTSIV